MSKVGVHSELGVLSAKAHSARGPPGLVTAGAGQAFAYRHGSLVLRLLGACNGALPITHVCGTVRLSRRKMSNRYMRIIVVPSRGIPDTLPL